MSTQLIINEPPLQVLPTLALELGLKEAIVLQQVHYWLQLPFSRHLIDDNYWVKYSPEQWERQFAFWDQKTLQRAIKNLEKLEVLISMVNHDSDKATYYTIDYWTLDQVTSPSTQSCASSTIPVSKRASNDPIYLSGKMKDDQ